MPESYRRCRRAADAWTEQRRGTACRPCHRRMLQSVVARPLGSNSSDGKLRSAGAGGRERLWSFGDGKNRVAKIEQGQSRGPGDGDDASDVELPIGWRLRPQRPPGCPASGRRRHSGTGEGGDRRSARGYQGQSPHRRRRPHARENGSAPATIRSTRRRRNGQGKNAGPVTERDGPSRRSCK